MDPYASSSSLLSPPASASPTPSPPSPKRRRTGAGNQHAIHDSDEDNRVAGFRCSAGFVSVKGRPLDGRGECRQHDSGYGEELTSEKAPGKESWKVRWSDLSWTHLEMCSVTMNTLYFSTYRGRRQSPSSAVLGPSPSIPCSTSLRGTSSCPISGTGSTLWPSLPRILKPSNNSDIW